MVTWSLGIEKAGVGGGVRRKRQAGLQLIRQGRSDSDDKGKKQY